MVILNVEMVILNNTERGRNGNTEQVEMVILNVLEMVKLNGNN